MAFTIKGRMSVKYQDRNAPATGPALNSYGSGVKILIFIIYPRVRGRLIKCQSRVGLTYITVPDT